LERFENSWRTNAPAVLEFGGVTLIELQADRDASDAKKEEIALAEAVVKRLKIEHKTMIGASMEKCDFVIDAIVGDRRFGPDCALYAGCGYIRESEKKKPGGRRPETPAG
jgi:hypothetical protein